MTGVRNQLQLTQTLRMSLFILTIYKQIARQFHSKIHFFGKGMVIKYLKVYNQLEIFLKQGYYL